MLSRLRTSTAWAQLGGAATSAANTVTLMLHTTPKRFVVRILRKVSETLWKVTPPSRKECNHLVDARTGMAEEIPRTLLLRPTCQRSTCLSVVELCSFGCCHFSSEYCALSHDNFGDCYWWLKLLCASCKCRVKIMRRTRFKSTHRWLEECFRQDVGGVSPWRVMVPVVPRPHHFLTFSTGRGYYRYPGVDWTLVETGPWPNSISRVLVSLMFPADCGHLS